MPTLEIERKFTVNKLIHEAIRNGDGVPIRQGYLADAPGVSVRVRIKDGKGILTIKCGKGIVRQEYEYPIPLEDAEALLVRCGERRLTKTRYKLLVDDRLWEVDVFHEKLAGIILAELELNARDESFDLPPWVDLDVSDRPQFSYEQLAAYVSPRGGPPTIEQLFALPRALSPEDAEASLRAEVEAGGKILTELLRGAGWGRQGDG